MDKKSIKSFNDLKVWQDAHKATLEIYRQTETFPKSEQFGIIDQLRRAVSSIGANIAEGFGRYHFKDKIRFYQQARGSAVETQNHLMLAKDLGYLKQDEYSKIILVIEEVLKELNGLIHSTGAMGNSRATND